MPFLLKILKNEVNVKIKHFTLFIIYDYGITIHLTINVLSITELVSNNVLHQSTNKNLTVLNYFPIKHYSDMMKLVIFRRFNLYARIFE